MNVCLYWSRISSSWSQGNWTWSECELIQDICAVWGTSNEFWGNADLGWSQCQSTSSQDVCKIWDTTSEWWKSANWAWPACSSSNTPPIPPITASVPITLGVDATVLIQPWLVEPWNPYRANDEKDKKRKRLIKLICKVKGQTYEEEKEVGSMNIAVDDVKMVVKKALNIDLDFKKLEE